MEPTIRQASVERVAARYALLKNAGPLRDVSKLRYQAVFMMGAGGSGKGYVSQQWMKYAPEAGPNKVEDTDRKLTDLDFTRAKARLESQGVFIEPAEGGGARIPFRLYTYDHKGRQQEVPPTQWDTQLPPRIYHEVQGMADLIFKAPKHEVPSYWRQVNPDIYKEEIPGYKPEQPGYVHEMSSEMSKAYFEAAIETGDPIFVDGTGANFAKMAARMQVARQAGYRISLVYVAVPMTVNQIRNATRDRKVNPFEVARQWRLINGNFPRLRGFADTSKVVVNRNDKRDIEVYKARKEAADEFIRRSTDGLYPDLYALIEDLAPGEISEWGRVLRG